MNERILAQLRAGPAEGIGDLGAEILRYLILLLAPKPADCCDRVNPVTVGPPINMQRKLADGTYESPANMTFQSKDVVRIGFQTQACLPIDIRIRFLRIGDRNESELRSIDDKDVGGVPSGDDGELIKIQDDIYQFAIEVDLAEPFLIPTGKASKSHLLTILVRDNCGRIGFGAAQFTMTYFDLP